MTPSCSHIETVAVTELPPSVAGCEDCLRDGGAWLHLRICLECGTSDAATIRRRGMPPRTRTRPVIP